MSILRFLLLLLGGFGVDFSSNFARLDDGLDTVSRGLLRYGVTSYLPTLVSSSPDTYRAVSPYASLTVWPLLGPWNDLLLLLSLSPK